MTRLRTRSRTILQILLAIGLIVPLALSPSTSVAAGGTSDELGESTEIGAIAEYLQVSDEEAIRRVRLQEQAGQLQAALWEDAADFGGMWIEQQPEFRIVVSLFEPSPSTLDLISRSGIDQDAIILIDAAMPLGDLELAAESILRRYDDQTRVFDLFIDVKTQTIVLTVPDAFIRADLLESVHGWNLGVPIRVDVGSLAEPAANLYGGMSLGSPTCTTGFSVRVGNVRGVTTAAHCTGSMVFSGETLTNQGSSYSGSHDERWASTSTHTVLNRAKTGATTYNSITSYSSRTLQVIGSLFCKYGRSAGFHCAQLVSNSEAPNYIPSAAATTMKMESPTTHICAPGDSGGPVLLLSSAKGTITGCAGAGGVNKAALYIAMNYVISGLSVTLITS